MAQHLLSIEIPDVLTNCIFRVIDTSTYNENVPLECPKLEITGPGFISPTVLEPGTDFSNNYTASDLGLQLTNTDMTRNTIPDGVYIVRYSVAPNDVVYVEYNHLRITQALNQINELLCCLDVPNCEPQTPIANKLREVQLLWTMLQAAKARVEYCHSPSEGMVMYTYVTGRLRKLACGCGCGTC
jgi:hypothetical protein